MSDIGTPRMSVALTYGCNVWNFSWFSALVWAEFNGHLDSVQELANAILQQELRMEEFLGQYQLLVARLHLWCQCYGPVLLALVGTLGCNGIAWALQFCINVHPTWLPFDQETYEVP